MLTVKMRLILADLMNVRYCNFRFKGYVPNAVSGYLYSCDGRALVDNWKSGGLIDRGRPGVDDDKLGIWGSK